MVILPVSWKIVDLGHQDRGGQFEQRGGLYWVERPHFNRSLNKAMDALDVSASFLLVSAKPPLFGQIGILEQAVRLPFGEQLGVQRSLEHEH